MRWPVDTRERYPIGPIEHGVNEGTAAAHLKRGEGLAVDIPAPSGTPLYPVHDAEVTQKFYDPIQAGFAVDYGWDAPEGRQELRYCHMQGAAIPNDGDAVTTGTVLGYVGSTGLATIIHRCYNIGTK